PFASTSIHQGFSDDMAMWFGTTSRTRPISCRRSSRTRRSKSRREPSSGLSRVGSTTSYPCAEPGRAARSGDAYRSVIPSESRYPMIRRASSKRKPAWNWTRYVLAGVFTGGASRGERADLRLPGGHAELQELQRVRREHDRVPPDRTSGPHRPARGVHHVVPGSLALHLGEREGPGTRPTVQQQECRVAMDRAASLVALVGSLPVHEHAEDVVVGGGPVLVDELLAVRPDPRQ